MDHYEAIRRTLTSLIVDWYDTGCTRCQEDTLSPAPPPGSRHRPPPPETATVADGTHPTGMPSFYTCLSVILFTGGVPGQVPPRTRYNPPPPPPRAVHAGRYGQQAGGTHPTGMISCLLMILDDTGQSGKRQSIFAFVNDVVLVGLNI